MKKKFLAKIIAITVLFLNEFSLSVVHADCGAARVQYTCVYPDLLKGEFLLTRRKISDCDPNNNVFFVGGTFATGSQGNHYSLLVWASDASKRAAKGINNIVIASFGIGDFSSVQDFQEGTILASKECRGPMIEDGMPFQVIFGQGNTNDQPNCKFRIFLPTSC